MNTEELKPAQLPAFQDLVKMKLFTPRMDGTKVPFDEWLEEAVLVLGWSKKRILRSEVDVLVKALDHNNDIEKRLLSGTSVRVSAARARRLHASFARRDPPLRLKVRRKRGGAQYTLTLEKTNADG